MADAYLVSVSAADDAAYVALRDLAEVLDGEAGAGIIGGHMVGLLTARFPSPGFVARRTNDADGGIPIALARSGDVHERLIARGYEPANSNRYTRKTPDGSEHALDLLVPNHGIRLGTENIGGRMFDSMPGLGLALARHLSIEVVATLRSGQELSFNTRVPSVEGAIILKTYAWSGRRAPKDAIDLHTLFRIVESHDIDLIGGWRLDEVPPVGARRDAGRILHELARAWEAQRPNVVFEYRQLIESIRTRVAPPSR